MPASAHHFFYSFSSLVFLDTMSISQLFVVLGSVLLIGLTLDCSVPRFVAYCDNVFDIPDHSMAWSSRFPLAGMCKGGMPTWTYSEVDTVSS
jgi:hypothetical protein